MSYSGYILKIQKTGFTESEKEREGELRVTSSLLTYTAIEMELLLTEMGEAIEYWGCVERERGVISGSSS